MIRKLSIITVVLLLTGAVFAAAKSDKVKVNGYVVDNMCAAAHAADKDVATTVKNHPKSCALMPACAKSGYSVLTDAGKLYKLDEAGNKKVADLLKNTKSEKGLAVAVEGTVKDDTLHVSSISEVETK